MTCLKEYFLPRTYSQYCQHLDSVVPDILACHLCCHGDACNSGIVPDLTTLYLPWLSTQLSLISKHSTCLDCLHNCPWYHNTLPALIVYTTVNWSRPWSQHSLSPLINTSSTSLFYDRYWKENFDLLMIRILLDYSILSCLTLSHPLLGSHVI